jgi:hypothetical protein
VGLAESDFREILHRKFLLELDGTTRPVDNWAMRGKPRHAQDDIVLVIHVQHDEFIIEGQTI